MNRQLVCLLLITAVLPGTGTAGENVTIFESRTSTAPSVAEVPFRVPPFSAEHQVRLSVEARIDAPRLAGSNPWIRVAVNGNSMSPDDLLNKRNEFKLTSGRDLTWFRSGAWRVLYSPDFTTAIEENDNPNACPNDDPYRFVWDITRHVRPGEENVLRIDHRQVLAKPSTLVLRNVREMLQYGAVYYGHYYDRDPAPWNFTEVMYPITPVELRGGMVLGEERIHTAKSGRFGWPDGSAADAYVVDAQGARVETPAVTEVEEGGRRLYEIRMKGDQFAVLVRRTAGPTP